MSISRFENKSWQLLYDDTDFKVTRKDVTQNAMVAVKSIKRYDQSTKAYIDTWYSREIVWVKFNITAQNNSKYDNDSDYLYFSADNTQLNGKRDDITIEMVFLNPLEHPLNFGFSVKMKEIGEASMDLHNTNGTIDYFDVSNTNVNGKYKMHTIPKGVIKVKLYFVENNPSYTQSVEGYFYHSESTVYKILQ